MDAGDKPDVFHSDFNRLSSPLATQSAKFNLFSSSAAVFLYIQIDSYFSSRKFTLKVAYSKVKMHLLLVIFFLFPF